MSRRSIQIKAILSLGVLVGLGSVSTLAAWTGTATATSPISAGTISLAVGGSAAGATTASYTVPITPTTWYPGTTGAATVVVKNTSSVSAPYSIKGSVTESGGATLGLSMVVSVKTGATLSGSTCQGGTEVVAKPAGSAFPADATRPALAAGASESLCVQYTLPINAANALQGASTSLILTFTASVGS